MYNDNEKIVIVVDYVEGSDYSAYLEAARDVIAYGENANIAINRAIGKIYDYDKQSVETLPLPKDVARILINNSKQERIAKSGSLHGLFKFVGTNRALHAIDYDYNQLKSYILHSGDIDSLDVEDLMDAFEDEGKLKFICMVSRWLDNQVLDNTLPDKILEIKERWATEYDDYIINEEEDDYDK